MTCFQEVPWYLQTGKLGHWSCCWRMALSGNNFCRSMQFVFFLFPRSFFWLTVYFSKCIFSLDLSFLTFGWQWATAEVPALHFKTGKLPLLWSILIVDFEAVMRIKLKNSLRLRSGVSSVWYFPSFSSSRHTKVSRPVYQIAYQIGEHYLQHLHLETSGSMVYLYHIITLVQKWCTNGQSKNMKKEWNQFWTRE